MPLNAEIRGGSHDGEIVRVIGPRLALPTPPTHSFVAGNIDRLPPVATYGVEYYQLQRGFDGELFYVPE